jgi:hypothetical protein
MVHRMAARNRPPRRPRTLDVADALREHIALSREHAALMREVAELRDAGKIGEARRFQLREFDYSAKGIFEPPAPVVRQR